MRRGGSPSWITRPGFHKVFSGNAQRSGRSTEALQSTPHALSVLFTRLEPDIDVTRCARYAVKRKRVGTDDQKSCLFREQRLEKVPKVFIQDVHVTRVTVTGR